jgi:hypothetical protein
MGTMMEKGRRRRTTTEEGVVTEELIVLLMEKRMSMEWVLMGGILTRCDHVRISWFLQF